MIVQYKSDPSSAEEGVLGKLGLFRGHLHSINALSVKVSPDQLTTLASRSGVSYISLDRPIAARQQVAPIGKSPQFTAEPINAPWAWSQNQSSTTARNPRSGLYKPAAAAQSLDRLARQCRRSRSRIRNSSSPTSMTTRRPLTPRCRTTRHNN